MFDIIIVTYNAKDKLKLCLKSVKKYTNSADYSLIIVNNHSTDGTSIFLKKYQKKNEEVKVINSDKNLGFSGGSNIALKNTFNKFIALLDDDIEVTKGWLSGLYKQIKHKPRVGIIGCKIVFPNNRIHSADFEIKTLRSAGFGEIDRGQRDYIKECDGLIGPCWLIRREVIKKVGYFDKRFFPCKGEDIDYCLRTRLAGYKIVYNGKVKIIHYHFRRYGDREQGERNERKLLRKWENILHKFPLKDTHPADKHNSKAIEYLIKKKYKAAFVEFKKAESIDERFGVPLYKGLALEGIGDNKKAIQEFKNVLYIDPSKISARYHLALIYKKIGLIKEAEREAVRTFSYILPHKEAL